MNKFTSTLVVALGLGMMSNAAFGAAGDIVSFTGSYSVATGIDGDCPLLASDTTIKTSSGVYAAFQCNETTNAILAAACSEGGSRATAAQCSNYDDDNDATTPDLIIGEGCTQEMVDAGEYATTPSYKGYGGTSAGGAMVTLTLGGRCTSGDILVANDESFWVK